jgi:hypothetical protein
MANAANVGGENSADLGQCCNKVYDLVECHVSTVIPDDLGDAPEHGADDAGNCEGHGCDA